MELTANPMKRQMFIGTFRSASVKPTTKNTMKKLSEYFGRDSAYWGERPDWLVCATLNRDSSVLARSNYRCFIKLLGGKGTEGAKGSTEISENVAIEEASHWACGWLQYLIINPACKELIELAEAAHERLHNYPVLDDDDFSALETEEANQIWRDCYNAKERANYVRKYRSQFEFHNLPDMLHCLRGKYFCGYASELVCR
jgi:hypothetical protein